MQVALIVTFPALLWFRYIMRVLLSAEPMETHKVVMETLQSQLHSLKLVYQMLMYFMLIQELRKLSWLHNYPRVLRYSISMVTDHAHVWANPYSCSQVAHISKKLQKCFANELNPQKRLVLLYTFYWLPLFCFSHEPGSLLCLSLHGSLE